MCYAVVVDPALVRLPQHPDRGLWRHAGFAQHTRCNVESVRSQDVD